MRTNNFKRLVVNASVAGSAGGKAASDSISINCTVFLETFLDECSHHIVMTPELSDEWDEHQSNFAATWLTSMITHRRFDSVEPPVNQALRDKIEKTAPNDNEIPAMRKDFHLLEAARETDGTIISLDKPARRRFARAALSIDEIKSVVWVNPDYAEEAPITWLENGAPPEEHRQLRTWAHTHV